MTNHAKSRIEKLRVRALRVPMKCPHRTASGLISESPLVLTDITTTDGIIGHSVIFTYSAAALKPTAQLIQNLEPLLLGGLLAPLEVSSNLLNRFRLLGTQGIVGMALAAIDMALWDALSRSVGIPLYKLLGGAANPVQAYGAVGYDGARKSAKVAEGWAKRGFKGVKAKIGYPSIHEDISVIRAMRNAVGKEVAIMADYNQCLTAIEAVERLRALDEEGLTWVEEPVLAHDYRSHAKVASESRTPIQCGENWWNVLEMQHAIDAHASDFMMLDVMKIGGVTGWMRGAALAYANGIRLSNHLWPEISAQLLCATPTAHWLEYCDWWNEIMIEPLNVSKGMAIVDHSEASGVAWNEKAVSRLLA